jgi:hypothetical protein
LDVRLDVFYPKQRGSRAIKPVTPFAVKSLLFVPLPVRHVLTHEEELLLKKYEYEATNDKKNDTNSCDYERSFGAAGYSARISHVQMEHWRSVLMAGAFFSSIRRRRNSPVIVAQKFS